MDLSTTIRTPRLVLRTFRLDDAPAVQRFCRDREIAANTATIPYPYEDGMAEEWITTHLEKMKEGALRNFAITLKDGGSLVGSIGLMIARDHDHAELGYWIGRPHWGRGYASEAARAVVGFGFEALGLARIHAHCFSDNPASARVLEKAGMTREGSLRKHFKKWGEFKDLEMYGILRDDDLPDSGAGPGRSP